MSVLTDRASVAYKLALQEVDATFRRWLADHLDAIDADGNQVICVFAPDEPVERMVAEVLAYPHPVIVATEVDGQLIAKRLGQRAAETPASHPTVVRVEDQTVADVMRMARGAGVQLEYSLEDDRALMLSA